MKLLLFIFITLFVFFLIFGHKYNVSSVLLLLGIYSLIIYRLLGYKQRNLKEKNTKAITLKLRRCFLLTAFVLFNCVVLHRAYVFGGVDIFFGVAWFVVTSLLLISKWKEAV